jgi:dipeptidyl aminopeptidase/acylaminoacyl peptidase
MRRRSRPRPAFVCALVVAAATALAPSPTAATGPRVQTVKIHYRSYSGHRRTAIVLLPASYDRRHRPELPLIISPHGRGLTGRGNARIWGRLPAFGNFAVVNPDGQGRRLGPYSWGYAGQVEDLARMPEILRVTLPWLRIDRTRIYAFGGSMGGQETLLLLARHPKLLAGAAVFDSVTDFARQYRSFPRLRCDNACRRFWKRGFGRSLQHLAREEIGGSPRTAPRAFARRSPITYVRRIAASCVPLQIWWSVADKIVLDQRKQSERLFREIRRLNPLAPAYGFAGFWHHSHEMQASTRLPLALITFGLLPPNPRVNAGGMHGVFAPAQSAWCRS